MFKNKNTRCVISVDRWTEEDKTAALDGFDCVCSCLKSKTLGVWSVFTGGWSKTDSSTRFDLIESVSACLKRSSLSV